MRKHFASIIYKINTYLYNNNAIFTIGTMHDELGTKFYFTPINNYGLDVSNEMPLFNIPVMDYVYDRIEQEFGNEGYKLSWNNTRNIFWIRE